MSVDFGSVPFPQSPIQDYFERRYRSSSASTTPTPSPNNGYGDRSIEHQLTKALTDLVKKQNAEAMMAKKLRQDGSRSANQGHPVQPLVQRRDSLATSTGYTKPWTPGHLKRRSLSGSITSSQASSRRPSR